MVQKARSVRSFAARLEWTYSPDRSSLDQLYLGSIMWMDLRALLLLQSRTKEQDGSPTNAKYKRFMKNKDTACYCKCCSNYIPAVSLRVSLLCFLHGIVFGTQTLWIHVFVRYVMSGSGTLEELLQDTAWKYSCEYYLTNVARACNFFYHGCVRCALSYIIKSRRRSDERM